MSGADASSARYRSKFVKTKLLIAALAAASLGVAYAQQQGPGAASNDGPKGSEAPTGAAGEKSGGEKSGGENLGKEAKEGLERQGNDRPGNKNADKEMPKDDDK
jgi:hypothetical protein